MPKLPIKFAFFGSSRFSVIALDELERAGFLPAFVVTTIDKPQGRKMILTPTPVKEWALSKEIKVLDPVKLNAEFIEILKKETLSAGDSQNGTPDSSPVTIFVVASYGKIIPQAVLDIPKQGTLNIHPSLLPKYRGASPLQSAILDDAKDTGITIMMIDAGMDHGPIIIQEKVRVDEWPTYEDFEKMMAEKGAKLLAEILPKWTANEIKAKEQDHTAATFTKKITKEDGLIDLACIENTDPTDQYTAFRKIQAFHEWPQAYFFVEHNGKNIRVKVTKASWQNSADISTSKLIIEKVIPEGSKEMSYNDFLRGYKISSL